MATKYLSKFRPGFVEAAEAKTHGENNNLAAAGTAIAT